MIEVKAKKTPAKKTTKKAKAEAKFTTCPVCVNGKGRYKNFPKHLKSKHGGRMPEVK